MSTRSVGGPGEGKRGREVDGGGGLADAALLVCDRYHLCLQWFSRVDRPWWRRGKFWRHHLDE